MITKALVARHRWKSSQLDFVLNQKYLRNDEEKESFINISLENWPKPYSNSASPATPSFFGTEQSSAIHPSYHFQRVRNTRHTLPDTSMWLYRV